MKINKKTLRFVVSKIIFPMKELFDERKLKILELIAAHESMPVKELSRLLKVSEATIRTDLDVLEGNSKITRFHGGARLIESKHKQKLDYQNRKNLNFKKKKNIGLLAAELVNDNESILLDASTTALAMAHSLRNRNSLRDVTLVPLGIWTAVELLGYKNFNIMLPGGYLRHVSASITGMATLAFFEGLIIQKAFLGAWGVSTEDGLSDRHLLEVELKKKIVKKAKEVIVMVDGSKFTQSGIASYASISKISKIITDSSAPKEEIEKIRALGIEVLLAD